MALIKVFQEKIPEVFSFLKNEYGFEIVIVNDHIVIGQKKDIVVHFVFDRGILFSVGIEVRGDLGELAISDTRYRKLGATAIARCLDKNYKPYIINIRNEDDLINQMKERALVLKKYCNQILKGDVSNWEQIVDCLLKG